MSDTWEEPTPPDRLPEGLIARIDTLEAPDLRAVLSYVEARLESARTPIEAAIRASTAGEIIDVEDHGAYALVRKHPPDPDGPGANADVVSLYHARRVRQVDGGESLRWTYLGNVHAPQVRCGACGRPLDRGVEVCPHCDGGDADRSGTEG